MTVCRHATLLSRMICVACNAAPKLRELERLAKARRFIETGVVYFMGGAVQGRRPWLAKRGQR